MSTESEIKKLKESEQTGFDWKDWCCCIPARTSNMRFWGAILLVCGGICLLSILNIFPTGLRTLGPILIICMGLIWLLRAERK